MKKIKQFWNWLKNSFCKENETSTAGYYGDVNLPDIKKEKSS